MSAVITGPAAPVQQTTTSAAIIAAGSSQIAVTPAWNRSTSA